MRNKRIRLRPDANTEAYFHRLEGESDAKELNYGQLPEARRRRGEERSRARDSSAIPDLTNSRRGREKAEAKIRGARGGEERRGEEREEAEEQEGEGRGKRRRAEGDRRRKRRERRCKSEASMEKRWLHAGIKGGKRARAKGGGLPRPRLLACLPPGSPVSIDSTPPTCWLSSLSGPPTIFLRPLEATSVNP